jgi:uncharacterized protein (DUF1778 family)
MKNKSRQQTETITFRVFPEVKAMLEEKSANAGLSVSGYVRLLSCGESAGLMVTKQKRLPVDMELLRKILGALGKIGNNHNQIAHHLNQLKGFDMEKIHFKVVGHRLKEIRMDLLRALKVIH